MTKEQQQNYMQLYGECRSALGLRDGEALVPTRFNLWLVDELQKLRVAHVMRGGTPEPLPPDPVELLADADATPVGQCGWCGGWNVDVTTEADTCHDCGHVYT